MTLYLWQIVVFCYREVYPHSCCKVGTVSEMSQGRWKDARHRQRPRCCHRPFYPFLSRFWTLLRSEESTDASEQVCRKPGSRAAFCSGQGLWGVAARGSLQGHRQTVCWLLPLLAPGRWSLRSSTPHGGIQAEELEPHWRGGREAEK